MRYRFSWLIIYLLFRKGRNKFKQIKIFNIIYPTTLSMKSNVIKPNKSAYVAIF